MSSPKNMTESFEDYLRRAGDARAAALSQEAKQASMPSKRVESGRSVSAGQSSGTNTPFTMPANIFSANTLGKMESFSGNEQKKILKFWYDMTACFGRGRIRQEFGDEPDNHLMRFAASLTADSYTRLKDNLEERLRKGQEWPPSIAVFESLTRTPTDKEILEARTNILTIGQPSSRVEKYIKSRKSAKLRTLSERNIAYEFRTLYIEAFEEVMLFDRDKLLDEQEAGIVDASANPERSRIDKIIDKCVEDGLTPQGPLGERLKQLNALRKQREAQFIDDEGNESH
ncbi:hypothetical protein [Enterovibrio sp. 27052020O]|uniref:hypothetical protein n=1 Tax=Enterovibrio sp. 27052020O TaxID=3241166 RepID=UPI0038906575